MSFLSILISVRPWQSEERAHLHNAVRYPTRHRASWGGFSLKPRSLRVCLYGTRVFGVVWFETLSFGTAWVCVHLMSCRGSRLLLFDYSDKSQIIFVPKVKGAAPWSPTQHCALQRGSPCFFTQGQPWGRRPVCCKHKFDELLLLGARPSGCSRCCRSRLFLFLVFCVVV